MCEHDKQPQDTQETRKTQESLITKPHPEPTDINGTDDVVRRLGNPGKFQILVFILLAFNYFPVVFHHVVMAFYAFSPQHQCRPKQFPASEIQVEVESMAKSYALHNVSETRFKDAHAVFGKCSASLTSPNQPNRTDRCMPGEWVYAIPEEEKTVVMEWDLVCDQAYMVHLAATVYYCGVMLGGFVCGYASDYFGRRPVILVTLAGLTVLGTALAFVRKFTVFLALRFFLGFFAQALQNASYILAVELFPVHHRAAAGTLFEIAWGAAVLALGGIAWAFKDWRIIQLAISVPSVLAVSYVWLIPESLRWLLVRGRTKDAARFIKRVASFNKLDNPLGPNAEEMLQSLQIHNRGNNNVEKKEPARGSIKDLFASVAMLKRSVIMFYVWLAGNVAYWGLTFMSTSLSGSRFLNYTLCASVEFFAYVIAVFVVRRFGRRNPLCVYIIIAAVGCLLVGLIPYRTADGTDLTILVTAFGVVGKFAAGGIFSIIELYTVEIYPTVLRNVGAGFCGFWGRLGAVLAPQFISLGHYTFPQLPAILFGAMSLLGGILILFLPDTSDLNLPDTVHEVNVQSKGNNEDMEKGGMPYCVNAPLIYTERVSCV